MFDIETKNAVLRSRGETSLNVEPSTMYNDAESKKTDLDNVLFQMHPKWGFPVSDLELMDDDAVSSQLRSAIERRNQPVKSVPMGNDDDDVVLDTMSRNGESPIDYYDRMKGYFEGIEKD